MGEHTPTPWKIVPPGEIVKATRIAAVEGGDFAYIPLSSPWREGAWDGDEIADANAAFIVRAVNSHDELLEALRSAERVLSDHGYREWIGGSIDDIRAAITKAEGRP